MSSTTYKVCSQCGAQMERRENVMTTSHPSLYIYDCPRCGSIEYDSILYPCDLGELATQSRNEVDLCDKTDYKAKYEEALSRAKELYKEAKENDWTSDIKDYEAIFPELRESEDEKIREEMIRHFQNILKEGVDTTTLEDTKRWLAWLEKQKDSIPYEKYVMDIAAMSAEMRTKYSAGWNAGYETKQKEQKPIPLMNGDADLYFDDLRMATQHVLTSREWFEEGIKYAQKLQKEPETASASSIPSCWEEKQKEQKPCRTCDEYDKGYKQGYTEGCTAGYNKAMLEQPKWKPSEEQMVAFRSYIQDFQEKAEAAVGGWNNYDVMIRLFDQLKKLMED